jgi:hypothetical protein
MKYFILPTCYIAFNAKAGSSTLACAIVKTYYPDIETKIIEDHQKQLSVFSNDFVKKLPKSFTNNALNSFGVWQRICPQTDTPDKLVLLPIRNPIERFKSSVAQFNLDVDEALNALENETKVLWRNIEICLTTNVHFKLQSELITTETKIYKFPEQLNQLAIDAGLNLPLPIINQNKQEKPKLSIKQIERIEKYYLEDKQLYDRRNT